MGGPFKNVPTCSTLKIHYKINRNVWNSAKKGIVGIIDPGVRGDDPIIWPECIYRGGHGVNCQSSWDGYHLLEAVYYKQSAIEPLQCDMPLLMTSLVSSDHLIGQGYLHEAKHFEKHKCPFHSSNQELLSCKDKLELHLLKEIEKPMLKGIMVILTVVHEMTMVSLKSNENFLNMTIVSLFVRISLSYIFKKRLKTLRVSWSSWPWFAKWPWYP